MQRFVRIGDANVTVLSAMMHDAKEAKRVAATLTGLRPEAIMVDRSVAEWTAPNAVEPYQKMVLETLPGLHANALWRAVAATAPTIGAELVLLHKELPGIPRAGVATLTKLLKREGFDASGDPARDLAKLHQHYVARVPEIWQAIESRRDLSAARIRATFETRPRRAVVVLAYPDADIVCDRIQAMAR